MKRFAYFLSLAVLGDAYAALPWWEQPSICRLDTTQCYSSMGTGYDQDMWDATANCRGIKYICADALSPRGTEAKLIGKNDLKSGTKTNPDFDINVLNGKCFGARKISSNGTTTVNKQNVNIWCPGILDNPDETVSFGEITYGNQPKCQTLANKEYAAVFDNKKCWGKKYASKDYFIDCGNSQLIPERLIILNGANYTTTPTNIPLEKKDADALFDTMYKVSQAQAKQYVVAKK